MLVSGFESKPKGAPDPFLGRLPCKNRHPSGKCISFFKESCKLAGILFFGETGVPLETAGSCPFHKRDPFAMVFEAEIVEATLLTKAVLSPRAALTSDRAPE